MFASRHCQHAQQSEINATSVPGDSQRAQSLTTMRSRLAPHNKAVIPDLVIGRET